MVEILTQAVVRLIQTPKPFQSPSCDVYRSPVDSCCVVRRRSRTSSQAHLTQRQRIEGLCVTPQEANCPSNVDKMSEPDSEQMGLAALSRVSSVADGRGKWETWIPSMEVSEIDTPPRANLDRPGTLIDANAVPLTPATLNAGGPRYRCAG